MATNIGAVFFNVGIDDKGLTVGLNKTGKKIASIGGKMIAGFGTAAIVKGITDVSLAFEDSFAKATTLIDPAIIQVDKLKDNIIDLSNETGFAANELNEGLYQALSAGVKITEDGADATAFLNKQAKLARGGFTSLEKSVDVTTTVMNAYGKSLDDVDQINNILIKTQNEGKTTVDQLSSVLGKVIPLAVSAGVSFEEVGAAMASLTANGINTAEAGTMLKAVFAEINKEGSKSNKALAEVTKKVYGTSKSFGELLEEGLTTVDVLQMMQKEAETNGMKLGDMFGSVEAGTGALVLANSGAEKFNTALENMKGDVDAVDEAFNTMSDTSGQKMQTALTNIKNAGIVMGETLLPIIADIALFITEQLVPALLSAVEWYRENETTVQLLALAFVTFKTALVAYSIQQAVATAVANGWSFVAWASTTATTAFGAAVAFLTSPITLIILAIGALIAAGILLVKHWDTVKAFAAKVWEGIGKGISSFTEGAIKAFEKFKDAIVVVFKAIANFVLQPFRGLIDGLNMLIRGINTLSFDVPDWVPGIGGRSFGFNLPSIPQIPSLDVGTDLVKNDGLSMIHKGEAVVPAEVAKGGFSGKGMNKDVQITVEGQKVEMKFDDEAFGELILHTVSKVVKQNRGDE